MPWSVKKEGEKYCVFKDSDGKKVACHKSEQEAEDHKKALYANTNEKYESLQSIMLEDGGPVILGVAATNRPHLPLPPMGVVERNGEKYIRVPFLRKGIFRHPRGNLIFDDKVFDQMLTNHKAGKSYYGVSLDIRHKPELGALAWFDDDRGGIVEVEDDPKYGKLLVGYGRPTSEKALEIVNNKEYAFASVEFHPNYKGNLIQKLSMDEEIQEIMLEDLMDEELALEEGNAFESLAKSLNEFLKKAKSNQSFVISVKEKSKDLEEAGFIKTKDGYALSYNKAKQLLADLQDMAYDSDEVEAEADEDNVQLFNSYHDPGSGKFTSKQGVGSSSASGKTKSSGVGFTKNRRGQFVRGVFEGAGFFLAGRKPKPLNRNHKKYQVIGRLIGGTAGLVTGTYAAYKIGSALGEVASKLEEKMDEVTITREEYDRLVALEQKLAELEKPAPAQEPELPEAVRVQLEEAQAEIKRLKRNALTTQVELVINKAQSYRDEAGRGHSPVLLEIARNAMLGQEISVGDGSIKLESSNPADVADYFRKVFVHLLETVPGQLQLESQVETEEEDNPFSETKKFEEADYKSFWTENL